MITVCFNKHRDRYPRAFENLQATYQGGNRHPWSTEHIRPIVQTIVSDQDAIYDIYRCMYHEVIRKAHSDLMNKKCTVDQFKYKRDRVTKWFYYKVRVRSEELTMEILRKGDEGWISF